MTGMETALKRADRDELGRLLPGHGIPGPGRSSCPKIFKDNSEAALAHIVAVARGDEEDRNWSRVDCCNAIVERVFGKTPAAPEDTEAANENIASVLLALAKPVG